MTLAAKRQAFDRLTNNARYRTGVDMVNLKMLEGVFNAGWQAAISVGSEEQELLELIASLATGLSIGLDWNNGTAANKYRDKLIDAVKRLEQLREGGGAQA